MTKIRASIIIVTFNGMRYLEDCLISLSTEIGAYDEIIIVDNLSVDGTPDYIKANWPEFILVQNQTNHGFAAACNQGALCASGEFLIFLNQDTLVVQGWLKGLIEPLKNDGLIGLTTSKLLLMSQPNLIQACGTDLHYTGLGYARGILEPSDRFQEAEIVGAVVGASFAIRQQIWLQLGGFNPEFFMYYEETDLSWRVQLAGYQCLYVPTSVVYHDYPLQASETTIYYSSRNRYLLIFRNWRCFTILLLSPGLLLAEFVNWGYVVLHGWPGIRSKIRAYGWLVSNLTREPQLTKYKQRSKPDWNLLETRTWIISPKIQTGGWIGQLLTKLANIIFVINGKIALMICRQLNY